VEVASNGRLAVARVQNKEYTVVLMDIQRPEMDGLQATQDIRDDSKYETLPIIALTANAMEDDRQRCLAAGMNDHLAKPIDPVRLYQAILKWAKPNNI
jgi:CheY-like chemotaxis protein